MILIQCVSSKKNRPLPAKELYDSTYFDALRRYAESTGEPWAIISAKHGLVGPNETLEPYDEFGLSGTQAVEIATELSNQDVERVELIAGEKYTNPLVPALEGVGIAVVERCKGLPIGKRVQKLQELARSLENEPLC
jgi:hypothetical protein